MSNFKIGEAVSVNLEPAGVLLAEISGKLTVRKSDGDFTLYEVCYSVNGQRWENTNTSLLFSEEELQARTRNMPALFASRQDRYVALGDLRQGDMVWADFAESGKLQGQILAAYDYENGQERFSRVIVGVETHEDMEWIEINDTDPVKVYRF